ncbi:MAG TPA: hypothetical protein VKR55_16090 [Bradyrhizobium sp.]|uniref:hypothetical protein n=1 Tax=Bradyrhizobium sp. TaxID=376 RepID=UPI002C6A13C6|nr:hypothetical protein [Bradyrhizobium sp.]HLZ03653.1 hypothetical protein [Bradyrhizobium sp.]
MSGSDQIAENLRQYLRKLSPQVRSRLLAELERLHLLGEDIPHSEPLIAALRAEFRNTGQSEYRIGNPSRYFFEPLEPVLVDGAPERANAGQIARGSLAPIWSLVTERLLPSMAADYVAQAKKAITSENREEARQIAAAFQKKMLTYLDGMLGTAGGEADVRAGLSAYTSSHAAFDELKKMLRYMRMQQELADFTRTLAPRIAKLEGSVLSKIMDALVALKMKRADALPFALTIVAKRLETPWELILLAANPAGSRSAAVIAKSPNAAAVSMVLDQIEEKRQLLLFALKNNRVMQAKEIVSQIYKIESVVKERIDLKGSDWDGRLRNLMAAVQATLDAEINSIPTDHQHLMHVLESPSLRPHSVGGRISQLFEKGRAALTGAGRQR